MMESITNLREKLQQWEREKVEYNNLNLHGIGWGVPQQKLFQFYFLDASLSVTTVKHPTMKYDDMVATSHSHTVVRLFGLANSPCNEASSISVCVNVHGYLPNFYALPKIYFDVGSPDGWTVTNRLEDFLNSWVFKNATDPTNSYSPITSRYFLNESGNLVERKTVKVSRSLLGNLKNPVYTLSQKKIETWKQRQPFYIIEVESPMFTELAAMAVRECGLTVDKKLCEFSTIDDQIPSSIKFLSDVGIVANRWFSLAPRTYYLRQDDESGGSQKESNCQIEIDVHLTSLNAKCVATAKKNKIPPPMRVVGLDLENRVRQGSLDRGRAEILQIGLELRNYIPSLKRTEPIGKVILLIGTSIDIPDAVVVQIGGEEWRIEKGDGNPPYVNSRIEAEMLLLFAECIAKMDPDIIMGQHIIGYDLPYIFMRIKFISDALKDESIKKAWCTSRLKEGLMFATTYLMEDEMPNSSEFKVELPGRILFDSLPLFIRLDGGHRFHKLSVLAERHLDSQFRKGDIQPNQINAHQDGGPVKRSELASYCLNDALLPIMLFEKAILPIHDPNNSVFEFILSQSRTEGVPLNVITGKSTNYRVAVLNYLKKVEHTPIDVLVDFVNIDLDKYFESIATESNDLIKNDFKKPDQHPNNKLKTLNVEPNSFAKGPTSHLTKQVTKWLEVNGVSVHLPTLKSLLDNGRKFRNDNTIPFLLATIKTFQSSTNILSTFSSEGELTDPTCTIRVQFHSDVIKSFGGLMKPGTALVLQNCTLIQEESSEYLRVQRNNIASLCTTHAITDYDKLPSCDYQLIRNDINGEDGLLVIHDTKIDYALVAK